MSIGEHIIEAFKFIWTFWNGVYNFIMSLTFPGFWGIFALDGDHATWHFFTLVVVYIALYIVICVFVAKLANKPLKALNLHMGRNGKGVSIVYNQWLYLLTILLFIADWYFFRGGPGTNDMSDLSASGFVTVAVLILIFSFIRLFIKAKWRAFYFMPLQMLELVYYYLLLLLFFPALVILLVTMAMGNAFTSSSSDKRAGRCSGCGGELSYGTVNCSCGRTVSW
jgi:hypothetical protein